MDWRGKLLQQRFGVEWRKGWTAGNQARQQAGHVWRGEAAASDFLYRARKPCDHDVLPGCDEFDEVAGAVEKARAISARGTPCKVYGDDGREMAGPFAFHEILIVAGGDDMASSKVGFVDPIFVVQHVIFAAATEAAI